MQSFSEIDARRERLGVSQRDLCGRADVNVSTYSRVKGADGELTPRILRKLALALDAIAAERGIALVCVEDRSATQFNDL